MVKQTAGRNALGEFAPKFAELNDDVLFGEVWSREEQLSLRDRSIVTVVALMSQGLTDSSFRYHLENAKKNGVTAEEMAEILTHAAFYAGHLPVADAGPLYAVGAAGVYFFAKQHKRLLTVSPVSPCRLRQRPGYG